MRLGDIFSALVTRYQAGNFSLTTVWPNTDETPTGAHARFWYLPAESDIGSLGDTGTDVQTGIVQLDLMYPSSVGIGDVIAKSDEIMRYFQRGHSCSYNDQYVLITGSSATQLRNEDGWMKCVVTIKWLAHVVRSVGTPLEAPDFTGYLTDADIISSANIPYYSASNRLLEVQTGASASSTLTLAFGTPGNTGKWLMLFKLTTSHRDANYNSVITAGFADPAKIGLDDYEQASCEVQDNATTVTHYYYHVAADAHVCNDTVIDIFEAPASVRYFAVAIDLASGDGYVVQETSTRIPTECFDADEEVFGYRLAGSSMAGFINIETTRTGSSSMGNSYSLELVASSVSHGLSLPAGYTNVVPS